MTNDVLVKAFALGPDAVIEPHDHQDATNVFYVVRGSVTVVRDGDEQTVSASGFVLNERGMEHGTRNEGDDVAVLTASLCPLPQG